MFSPASGETGVVGGNEAGGEPADEGEWTSWDVILDECCKS